MDSSILSVGIDVGTTTTSMVLTRLGIRNTAPGFLVPRISIVSKEIIYRSGIYITPQLTGNQIDITALAEIIKAEYLEAGITPERVQTGAVIITGESARKDNAEQVTEILSGFAGDFVVATAGPDLESVIAAQGAGIQQHSQQTGCIAVNFDVGGGTTNIAVFRAGEVLGCCCLDVGGRLVRVEKDGSISYVSASFALVAQSLGLAFYPGEKAEPEKLRRVTDRMAELIGEAVGMIPGSPLCEKVRTPGSSILASPGRMDCLSFSGGVADHIRSPGGDWFVHGDIGPLLADSILRSTLYRSFTVIPARETIRATVIGAGAYTTSISGSTISYSGEEVFPVRNLPAFVPGREVESCCLLGDTDSLWERADWFLKQSSSENVLFCFKSIENPTYRQLSNLADVIAKVAQGLLSEKQSLFVLTEYDFAKALGQALKRRIPGSWAIVCIDGIRARQGDYIDLGRPVAGGLAVPVVVKTLIYG